MTEFFSWYLIVTLLGWLTFPLVYQLFPALSDRGYTLARTAGLLVWGYVFWLFVSFGFARNDIGGMTLALTILIGLSLWSLFTNYSAILSFLRSNVALILTAEVLFFIAFAFLAFTSALVGIRVGLRHLLLLLRLCVNRHACPPFKHQWQHRPQPDDLSDLRAGCAGFIRHRV